MKIKVENRCPSRESLHHHITAVAKSSQWLKIPEHNHLKVLSSANHCLQYSQPKHHDKLNHSATPLYLIILPSDYLSCPQLPLSFSDWFITTLHLDKRMNFAPNLACSRFLHQYCHSPSVICPGLLYISPLIRLSSPNWSLTSLCISFLIHLKAEGLPSFFIVNETRIKHQLVCPSLCSAW